MTAEPSHLATLEEEETPDMLQKKYEEMSFEEMSQRMAESNRQISQMLSSSSSSSLSSSSFSSSTSTSYNVEQQKEDKEDDPYVKWNKIFHRSASSADITKLQELLSNKESQEYIDINARDSDGAPSLIYAACFGKIQVAQFLLDHGAQIDIQDSFGWSALMWATNNNHEKLVQLLLDHGASSTTKSTKGRTVFDFVGVQSEKNQKLIDILTTNPRDSCSSTTSSLFFKTTCSSSTSSSNSEYYYQQSNEEQKKLFESTMQLVSDLTTSDDEEDLQEEEEQDEDDYSSLTTAMEFYWDKCVPDQMFVFNSNDLDYILDTMITNIQLPLQPQNICVPANIIFLSARFAHYFSSHELLFQVLEGALSRISKLIKINHRDVHLLSFWITNTTRLLYYLKRDSGLVVVTAEQQLNLSELIQEIYNYIILDTEKRLSKLLVSAMLIHEEMTGVDQVDFTDEWRLFKSTARKSIDHLIATPQSITNLLSSTLFVLQSYHVHPIIIIQALAQFFHYISCELFNRILTNKKLLCRSKAIQIRMNFSHLQDWISVNKLSNNLLNYLNPTIQLLQLLTCLTHLQDLMDFINTTKSFDLLNAPQIKRCVISYRYEVNEQHLPEEIEKYAMQCAEDTIRNKQQRKKLVHHGSTRSSSSARTSTSTMMTTISEIKQVSFDTERYSRDDDREEEDEEDDIKETKDSKFMLPFSVPTTSQMLSSWHHWGDHTNKTEEEQIIPIIPEEWMDKLDKPSSSLSTTTQ